MYTGLKHLHSSMPYFFLPLLVVALVVFAMKWQAGKPFGKSDKRLALFTMILAHLQFLVGLTLYFVSPTVKAALESGELMSNSEYRFYGVEHISTMIIAIVLITIGYSRAKRLERPAGKFKALTLFFLIGLLLVLARIPWQSWPSFG